MATSGIGELMGKLPRRQLGTMTTVKSSPSFNVAKAGDVVALHIQAPIRGLVTLDATLRAVEQPAEFTSQPRPFIALPHGRVLTRYLRATEAGPHVLEMHVDGDPKADLHVTATGGHRSGRPPFGVAVLLLIYPGACLLRNQRHESRRWSEED